MSSATRKFAGRFSGRSERSDEKILYRRGQGSLSLPVDLFDAEKDRYPYEDGRFETVLACEIFEHMLHDPMHMLIEMHRVLEEGGTLVLTTPNVASYLAVARVLEQSGNPQLYSKFPYPLGEFAETEVPHVREYTPAELREAVESAGFEVENLFTEVIAGYRTESVGEGFSGAEQIFVGAARESSSTASQRSVAVARWCGTRNFSTMVVKRRYKGETIRRKIM